MYLLNELLCRGGLISATEISTVAWFKRDHLKAAMITPTRQQGGVATPSEASELLVTPETSPELMREMLGVITACLLLIVAGC